jgi:hypothetical protein
MLSTGADEAQQCAMVPQHEEVATPLSQAEEALAIRAMRLDWP